MSIEDVTVSDSYFAGETVISSFTVRNDSDHDITPDKANKAKFTAYYYNGSQKVVIATDTWNNVVIPSGKANLVYFKWTVPSNLAGKTVYCECTINSDAALNEENRGNNTVAFSNTVISFAESQTPNTRYESSKPGSYKGYSAPANSTDKARGIRKFNQQDAGLYLSMMKATIGEAIGIDGSSDEVDLLQRRIDTLNAKMLNMVTESVKSGADIESNEDEFKSISEEIEQLKSRIKAIQESICVDEDYESRVSEYRRLYRIIVRMAISSRLRLCSGRSWLCTCRYVFGVSYLRSRNLFD